MRDCRICGEEIIGDGTEDGDDVICGQCKGDISYQMLVDDDDEPAPVRTPAEKGESENGKA